MARLDLELVARGLSVSRTNAKNAVLSGNVRVNGKMADKPSHDVADTDEIEVIANDAYVSRGGHKLAHALDAAFGINVADLTCADIGASTGGFTDCLLKHGASKVYAIDVGQNQLAQILRNDPRVVSLERVNARELSPDLLGETVAFVCADVSFISLRLILPAVRGILSPDGAAVCLVKPQFEAGRGNVGKNGVVRDVKTHVSVLEAFVNDANGAGFVVRGLTHSPVRGGDGNIEFLAWLGSGENAAVNAKMIVTQAHIALKD